MSSKPKPARSARTAAQPTADELLHFFDQSPDLLCIAGFDGVFKRLNPAWSALLGWTTKELRARPFLDFVHPDDRPATLTVMDQLDSGAVTLSFENRYRCKDGSWKSLRWTASPLPNRQEIYAIARDVTRQKNLELQILAAAENEQQRISRDLHDSLGPHLAAIRYAATFLAEDLRQRHPAAAAKADLIDGMAGVAVTIGRDLARGIFPVQLHDLGLAPALKQLAATSSRQTDMRVTFSETGGPRPTDPADDLHLYRIAQEALSNAAKHSSARHVALVLQYSEHALRLTVADDGQGLPLSPHDTHGMGLDSMRYRAHALGGKLTLDSCPHGGTIVACEIPIRPLHLMPPSPALGKKRILIVEDHPLFRAMLAQLIEQELGMAVCGQAGNLSDALILLAQTQPDAAIVDLNLSGTGGLELIKEMNARQSRLPVLVLSMHGEKLHAERALRAGAKGYISKEQSPAEVAAAIRTVVDGGIYASMEVTKAILGRRAHGEQQPRAQEMDSLSDRELEVFQLIGEGLTSREISARLRLVASTVDSYRARIKQKLALKNAAELYQRAALWIAGPGA